MRILAIIPARGGSKGIPRKNLKLLAGKPLLQYTAEAALAAKSLDRIILSTDDEEIAELGRSLGLEVPFLRPAELAQDDTPTLPVIQHAIRFVENESRNPKSQVFDLICLLQPTNPFRTATTIDACINLFKSSQNSAIRNPKSEIAPASVITTLPVPQEHNPHWVYMKNGDGFLHLSTGEKDPIPRRQDLPAAYHREGSVYVTRRDVIMDQNSLFGDNVLGYPIDPETSVNLDTPADWKRAETMLTNAV